MRAPMILALLLAACPAEEPERPTQPPLDPVDRTAAMLWTVEQAPSAALIEAFETYRPDAVLFGGQAGAVLDGVDAALLDGLLAVQQRADAVEHPAQYGFELPPLPPDTPSCLDPADPFGDPNVALREAALRELLSLHTDFDFVSLPLPGDQAPWDVPCSCPPCAGDEVARAGELSALWQAFGAAIEDSGPEPWWHDGSSGDDGASVDHALLELHPEAGVHIRVGASRAGRGIWAPDGPMLGQGARRQVGADLDLLASRFGPSEALLWFPADLADRLRRHRRRGVQNWFVQVNSAHTDATQLRVAGNLAVSNRFFIDFDADPSDAMLTYVTERFELEPESAEAAALVAALENTGRALDLATHPLGLSQDSPWTAVPGAGAMDWVDPGLEPEGWSDRYGRLNTPDLQTLVDAHQWLWEGVALAEASLASFELARDALTPDDRSAIQRGLDVLLLSTLAWARRVDADLALRHGSAAYAWARDDADALDALADTAVAMGGLTLPVDPAQLMAAADWIRATTGPGAVEARPFPVITEVRFDFVPEEARTNIRWRVTPQAVGWTERGSDWPLYTESSALGDAPASQWTSWVRNLEGDSRHTFRACAETAEYTVCSADHVLWTPP